MNINDLIILCIELNIDIFIICFSIGIFLSKANSLIFISLIFSMFECIIPFVGFFLGNLFGYVFVYASHYISTMVLLFLGINLVKECYQHYYKESQPKNIIFLFGLLFFEELLTGIHLSLLKKQFVLFLIIFFFISFLFCYTGLFLGNIFRKHFIFPINLIAGTILISLAISNFTHIFFHIKPIYFL